jgi:type I restriction enzyme S subunit
MSSKGKSSAEPSGGAALVPKLRFPEFQEADGWKENSLQTLARPVTDRATTGDADNVLSLSGEHGLVLQSDYFGKKIAGDSTARYLKIRKDDFVYNDRTTKASRFGTIKRLSNYAGGIVSPIYKCFRFQPSENPVFWEWYFESGSHDPALGGLVNEGARAGRFNISVTQFLSTNAWRPDEAEQQKIADCLVSADAMIAAQGRKVEALNAHKKGLIQQLFPQEGETQPRLRFPEFEGAGEWEKKAVGDVFKVTRGEVLSMTLVNNASSDEAPYPVFSSQTKNFGLAGYYSRFLYQDAITWTTDGANAGDVNFRPGKFFCMNRPGFTGG